MKTQTTVAQIVAGKNAEVVIRIADLANQEVVTFVMEQAAAGITVGITPRNPHNKKEHVEELAKMVKELNNALESTVQTNQNQSKGEVNTMTTTTTKARIEELKKEAAVIERMAKENLITNVEKVERLNNILRESDALTQEVLNAESVTSKTVTTNIDEMHRTNNTAIADYSKRAKNPAFKNVADRIDIDKDRLIASRKTNDITVLSIVAYANPDRNNRIGEVVFEVPAGMMEVSKFNFVEKKPEWLPMETCNYNGFARSNSRVNAGSGLVKLAIKADSHGVPFISWPKTPGKQEGVFYDVFRTVDARFDIMHSDNNHNVQAALTAFVLTFWGEFKQANPRNRAGFNQHCGNCRHMVYLPVFDGTEEEYDNKTNAIDTSELGQWGSRMPQWICGVSGNFVDAEAIDDVNESTSYENRQYHDEEGVLRFARPNEVVIAGKPVNLYKVRAQGSEEQCASCPFYAKNERKSDKKYGQEVERAVESFMKDGGRIIRDEAGKMDLKAMGIFVQKYFTERAQSNAQPVFTKHNDHGRDEWTLGFPGEFETSSEFMVQGLGGVNVYGDAEVMEYMNKGFVATTEEFDENSSRLSKLIDMIYNVSFNFARIEPQTLDNLLALIQAAPQAMKPTVKSRYERALAFLATTIQDNQ
jgi:hypothetical protein